MSAKEAVDFYGFPLDLSASQQAHRVACSIAEQQSSQKWKPIEAKKRLPSKSSLKALIRKGIPAELRGWVWSEVSGATRIRASCGPSYYGDMVSQGQSSPCIRQIDLDLPRTFPGHAWLQSADGQASLRRVLQAFATRNAQIGYCQSMNYLAGILLLVTKLEEEQSFYLMVALVEGILYPGTYSSNLQGCHVEMRTLSSLLLRKLPALHAHLESLGADVSILATDWYLCLFATTFPIETVLRIWDCLMAEGGKVLFRVAVAHLQINQAMMLGMDNAGELLKGLKDAGRGMHDREALLRVAFKGVGSFPMARITTLRASHKQPVEDMVKEREARKRRRELKDAISSARQLHQAPPNPPPGADVDPSQPSSTAADLSKTLSAGLSAIASFGRAQTQGRVTA